MVKRKYVIFCLLNYLFVILCSSVQAITISPQKQEFDCYLNYVRFNQVSQTNNIQNIDAELFNIQNIVTDIYIKARAENRDIYNSEQHQINHLEAIKAILEQKLYIIDNIAQTDRLAQFIVNYGVTNHHIFGFKFKYKLNYTKKISLKEPIFTYTYLFFQNTNLNYAISFSSNVMGWPGNYINKYAKATLYGQFASDTIFNKHAIHEVNLNIKKYLSAEKNYTYYCKLMNEFELSHDFTLSNQISYRLTNLANNTYLKIVTETIAITKKISVNKQADLNLTLNCSLRKSLTKYEDDSTSIGATILLNF